MRTVLCMLGLAAAMTALGAHAQDPPEPRMITPPDATTITDSFPVVALANGVGGTVILVCDVTPSAETSCRIEEESPANAGFGAAALRLMQTARFAPAEVNGVPVASVARIPVRFPTAGGSAPILRTLNVTGTIGAAGLPPLSEEQRRSLYYPEAAKVAGMEGDALVACAVRTNANVECDVEREEPAGWGFGERAVYVATRSMSQATGLSPGDVFKLQIRFGLRQADEPNAPRLEQPDWLRAPSPAQLRSAYPARALRERVEGRVALLCEIKENGRLQCEVVGESPAGYEFAEAALGLGAYYEVAPEALGAPGRSIGDRLLIPVRFQLSE